MALCRIAISFIPFVLTSAKPSLNLRAVRSTRSTPEPSALQKHHANTTDKNCECLNWKDVYAEHKVTCGAGGEYQPLLSLGMTLEQAQQQLSDEFCGKLFQRIDDNFCVNKDWVLYPLQWCYVSKACSKADGFSDPSVTVAVKTCSPGPGALGPRAHGPNKGPRARGGDKMLMDYSFEEVYNLAKKENLDIGLLAQYAWKNWNHSEPWSHIEHQMMRETGPARPDLREMVASHERVFFTSDDGHPPFHLVSGPYVYEIHFGPDTGAYEAGRMGNVNELVRLK